MTTVNITMTLLYNESKLLEPVIVGVYLKVRALCCIHCSYRAPAAKLCWACRWYWQGLSHKKLPPTKYDGWLGETEHWVRSPRWFCMTFTRRNKEPEPWILKCKIARDFTPVSWVDQLPGVMSLSSPPQTSHCSTDWSHSRPTSPLIYGRAGSVGSFCTLK